MDLRLHFSLAGFFVGSSLLPAWREVFLSTAGTYLIFFGGWVGLVIGCSLDLRLLRRQSPLPLLFDCGQAVLTLPLVFFVVYLAGYFYQDGGLYLGWPTVLMAYGICAVSPPYFHRSRTGTKTNPPRGFWKPSTSTLVGLGATAIGSTALQGQGFSLVLPADGLFREISIDGTAVLFAWSLVLGGGLGLLCDLLIKSVHPPEHLAFILAGVLLLGGGLAAKFGLDLVWVGLVTGCWLINATLRRLDVLEVIERRHANFSLGLFFLAGWYLGDGLRYNPIDEGVFIWMAILVVRVRSIGKIGGLQLGRRLWGRRAQKERLITMAQLFNWDELGLFIGMTILEVLAPSAGLGILAAVLGGQLILRLAGMWLVREAPIEKSVVRSF